MTITTAEHTFHPERVTDMNFWSKSFDERDDVFARLRADHPITWHPPMEADLMPSEQPGVWVVVRHEDIAEVSKSPARFCSGKGVQFEDAPEDLLEASHSFLAMDAPRHGQLRRLVSAAFTPKQVAKIDHRIREQAGRIVDGLLAEGGGDFVDLVSKQMPMWTIYEMMGLDPALRAEASHMADEMVAYNDPDVANGREPGEVVNESLVALLTTGLAFADLRRREPADDLMTGLVNAEVDGNKLTDDEIAAFFVLASVGGNDTTRNTISFTSLALQEFPQQRAWLMEDYDGRIRTAVEEFIRWASPVMTFRRTATQDTVLAGQPIAAGEWVAMMYSSGNRDERVFDHPREFDLSRHPNPHQGFGGGGPHFCMGNFLAKMQITHLWRELLTRVPTLEVGEPQLMRGNFVRAVKSLPCEIR
ncbi:cytochrome P450 [Gordonia sp. NPDC003429]